MPRHPALHWPASPLTASSVECLQSLKIFRGIDVDLSVVSCPSTPAPCLFLKWAGRSESVSPESALSRRCPPPVSSRGRCNPDALRVERPGADPSTSFNSLGVADPRCHRRPPRPSPRCTHGEPTPPPPPPPPNLQALVVEPLANSGQLVRLGSERNGLGRSIRLFEQPLGSSGMKGESPAASLSLALSGVILRTSRAAPTAPPPSPVRSYLCARAKSGR